MKPHPQVQALSTSQSGKTQQGMDVPSHMGVRDGLQGGTGTGEPQIRSDDGIWHGMQELPGRGNMREVSLREMEEGTCLWSRASEYT